MSRSAAAGDVNANGLDDLVVSTTGGAFALYGTQGRGLESRVRLPTSPDNSGVIRVADVNADGRQDVVLALDDRVIIYVQSSAGELVANVVTLPQLSTKYGCELADVDGNGRLDVVLLERSSPNAIVQILHQDAPGNWAALESVGLSPIKVGSTGSYLAVGDLNGDFLPDIAMTDQEGQLWLLYRDPQGMFIPPVRNTSTGANLFLGDVNGDGLADLALARYDSIAVLPQLSNGALDLPLSVNVAPSSFGGALDQIAAGDFNGDGLIDIAITDQRAGIGLMLSKP